MALKKKKRIKGYEAEYWKITWFRPNTINYTLDCELALFKDRPTREIDISAIMEKRNFSWTIPREFENVSKMTVRELVGFIYSKITESKMITVPILDEFGNPTYKYNEKEDRNIEVTKEVESNWFVDAIDILEI